jgi:hypothetical protein
MEKVLVNAADISHVQLLSKICMLLCMSHYAEIEIAAGKGRCVQKLLAFT